jgi:large conductance mechanosensitive channel
MKEVSKQLGEFKKFILRGNVVDLAVAVVIGAAFNEIVQSLVKGFITPLIAVIVGQPDFATLNRGDFKWGDIVNAIVSFVLMAAVVFFLIIQPLNRFMAHVKPAEEVDRPSERSCPECLSPIPSSAKRCKFCTTIFASADPKEKKLAKVKE